MLLLQLAVAWSVVFGVAGAVRAQAGAAPDLAWLTAEERAWLAAHRVVRTGTNPSYAPYAFIDTRGEFKGVAADTLALLEPMLGVRFELVRLPSWPAVLDALREKRIDLVAAVAYLPERDAYMAFSNIYIQTPLVIMTRSSTPRFDSPDRLAEQRVALVKGYSSSQTVLERYPEARVVEVETAAEGLIAVSEGRADAYIGAIGVNQFFAKMNGLDNLKVNIGFEMQQNGQRFGVRKDWVVLSAILDKALERIPIESRIAILGKWAPVPSETPVALPMVWTGAQNRWIEQHRQIRVGVEPDQPPYSSVDSDGVPHGMLVDMWNSVAQAIGQTVVWVPGKPDQLVAMLVDGRLDAVLDIRHLASRQQGLVASLPLYQSSYLLICRREDPCSGSLVDLKGKVVAAAGASPTLDDVQQRQPEMLMQSTGSLFSALRALQSDKVDAVLGEARAVLRILDDNRARLPDLKVGGVVGDGILRMGLTAARRFDRMDPDHRARRPEPAAGGVRSRPQSLARHRVGVGAGPGSRGSLWPGRRDRGVVDDGRNVFVDAPPASRGQAAPGHRARAGAGARRGRNRQPRQECLSDQHEPRDSHPAERASSG